MADSKKGPMLLRLVDPSGLCAEIGCDSIHLPLADDENGRGGGDICILRGHTPAVMALRRGPARVFLGGKAVFSRTLPGGFASVKDNIITVVFNGDP